MRRFSIVLLLAGCSSIPVIRFSGSDAQVDAGDAETDGTMVDGASDANTMAEAGIEGGCPGTVPPGAIVCCGPIPCGNQYCSAMACTDCQTKCVVGALCCPNQGGKATCHLDASVCP